MTVFSGFFNSDSTHDRWYNAQHFSRFFDGLITDGVYYNFPESETDQTKKAFYVKSKNTGRQVTVAQGRGWFRGTWIWNDAPITLEFDALVTNLAHRIDAVVIDCDTSDEGRLNDIIIVKGTEAATSQTAYRPTLIDTETHKQYAIAFVEIIGGATAIAQANITYVVAEPQIDEIGHDAVQPVLPDPQGTPAVEALLLYSNLSKAEMKEYIDTQDAIIQRQVNEMNKPPFEELGTSSDLQRITGGSDADYLYKKVNTKASILTKIALLVNKLIDIGLPVKYGGTGRKTLTANSVLVGDTENNAQHQEHHTVLGAAGIVDIIHSHVVNHHDGNTDTERQNAQSRNCNQGANEFAQHFTVDRICHHIQRRIHGRIRKSDHHRNDNYSHRNVENPVDDVQNDQRLALVLHFPFDHIPVLVGQRTDDPAIDHRHPTEPGIFDAAAVRHRI